MLPTRCLFVSSIGGVLVQCSGIVEEIVENEGGAWILYEVCRKCNQKQSLIPITLSEKVNDKILPAERKVIAGPEKRRL